MGYSQWAQANPSPQDFFANSAAVSAAANNVSIPANGRFTWVSGFSISGQGATAGSNIIVNLTGLAGVGGGTLSWVVAIPTGATTILPAFIVTFPTPLPASANNTAITINVPSFGAGNTTSIVGIWGFYT